MWKIMTRNILCASALLGFFSFSSLTVRENAEIWYVWVMDILGKDFCEENLCQECKGIFLSIMLVNIKKS